MASAPHGKLAKPPARFPRRTAPHSHAAHRRGGFRGVSPQKISRRENFFARRLRNASAAARSGHRKGRPSRRARTSSSAWPIAAGSTCSPTSSGKDPREIFREFADAEPELWPGRGDVKYHLGHSGDWTTADGSKIHLSLCFNPSHLEFVNPVVLGRVRAQQDRFGDRDRRAGAGRADSRRRGVCRRRRRSGNAQPEQTCRLHRRRRAAHHRQQPDRFHHAAGTKAARPFTRPTWRGCCRSRSFT